MLTTLRLRLAGLMSLRLRLAVLAGLAAFVVVALFGTGVYVVLSKSLYDESDTALQQYAIGIEHRVNRPPLGPAVPMSRILLGGPDTFVIA